jgi:hypothetical protein
MANKIELTEEQQKKAAIEARRAYQREWRKRNKDKIREYNDRFWIKKGAELANAKVN